MNRIELGELLNNKRRETGRTLRELAELLNVSVNYLSSIEKGGIRCPGKERLTDIAKHYGVDLAEINRVFYPSNEFLAEAAKVDQEFANVLQDSVFFDECRKRIMKEKIGVETKKMIIELVNRLKNPQLSFPLQHHQMKDGQH